MGCGWDFVGDGYQPNVKSWVRQHCRGFVERSKCCSTAASRPLEIHRGVFIPFSSRRASRLEFPYQLRQVSATTRARARKSWLYLPQKLFPVFPPLAKELDVIQQPLGLQTSLSICQQQVLPVAGLFASHNQLRRPRFVPAVSLGVEMYWF